MTEKKEKEAVGNEATELKQEKRGLMDTIDDFKSRMLGAFSKAEEKEAKAEEKDVEVAKKEQELETTEESLDAEATRAQKEGRS